MPSVPGYLDFNLEMHPLRCISPSRFQALEMCALGEVWSSEAQPHLLADSAASHLGSVIHKLLQAAGTGEFNVDDPDAIRNYWDALIREEEMVMAYSWLERHLVPLSSSVPEYEVRRLQALNAVSRFVPPSTNKHGRGSRSLSCPTGPEIKVIGPGSLITGYIDYVYESSGELVLRDYKSGDIWDRSSSGDERVIKPSYQVQLKLYAALYAASFGRWPSSLEIVALSGESVSLPVDTAECQALLGEGLALISGVNAIIETPGHSIEGIESRLANPGMDNCRFCPFRPGCRQYQKTRNCYDEAQAWPTDAIGTCKEVRALRNNTFLAVVDDRACTGTSIYIRGLNANAQRHPALYDISQGSITGFFNLRLAFHGGSFTETQATVIYRYAKPLVY